MKATQKTEVYSLRKDDKLDKIIKENFYCPECKQFQLNIYVNWMIIHWWTASYNRWPMVCNKCSEKHFDELVNEIDK